MEQCCGGLRGAPADFVREVAQPLGVVMSAVRVLSECLGKVHDTKVGRQEVHGQTETG